MATLATINGEALSVPGLRFWGHRPSWNPQRFAIIAQDARGAVELWSEPLPRPMGDRDSIGGVEVHSPKQLYEFAPEPVSKDCEILPGTCWADGSSLAYVETFLPMIRVGDSAGILRELADWHRTHFGGK